MKKILTALVCVMFLFSPGYAKEVKKVGKSALQNKGSDKWLNVEIVNREREIIKNYYHSNEGKYIKSKKSKKSKKKKLPPGLRKKIERGGDLPPGWQKKVARGEVLDPEVYKHAEPLPPDLIEKLPPQPEDAEFLRVKGKIIRILKATRTILDVFDIDL